MICASSVARVRAMEHGDLVLTLAECLSRFPSLALCPRELAALDAWFDDAGPTEQAAHAAAFVLERFGVPGIQFEAAEALLVWDRAHRSAYAELKDRPVERR